MQQSLSTCLQVALGLGFEQADRCCISRKLSYIEPSGGTKMRDSIMMGTNLMYKFRAATEKLGLGSFWNFVHLVITDGADEGSSTTLEELGTQIYLLMKICPSGFMKTIYVGVDIENNRQALAELATLRVLGGDSADIIRSHDDEIAETFEKIKISLGIQTRTQGLFVSSNQGTVGLIRQQNQAFIQAERQRYMVLFNIDRSGSMYGQKWNNLCRAVSSFLNQLGSDDLVCGLVFNSDVEILSNMNVNRQPIQQSPVRQPVVRQPVVRQPDPVYQPLQTQPSQSQPLAPYSKKSGCSKYKKCIKWFVCISVVIIVIAIVIAALK